MVAVQDRHSGVTSERPANERLVKPTRSTPQTRSPWVAPTWQRLDTPMEITMYAGRR